MKSRPFLSQYDCMVLSNIEASQSGVVALAHGFGMPVVATPVGGLTEQIKDRHSGLDRAFRVAADCLSRCDGIVCNGWRVATGSCQRVSHKVQDEFSMARFFERLTERRSRVERNNDFGQAFAQTFDPSAAPDPRCACRPSNRPACRAR